MVASTCRGVRGSLSVDCFDRYFLPNSSALGAGLPVLPGSCSIELLPSVLHTLRQPGFPRKLRLRGCRRCLRLRILSGRSFLVILSARYPSLASSPSTLVASWYGGSGACLPIFPFSFSFGVLVTPGFMDRKLEGAFPSGCSSFNFRVALPLH